MFGPLQHLFHPTQCYALCALARPGAHLLSDALQATQLAGRAAAVFSTTGWLRNIRSRCDAKSCRVSARSHDQRCNLERRFGFRIESWDVERLVSRLRESGEIESDLSERELLHPAFPGLCCIQLTREDKLRRAISTARVMQTNL